MPGARGDWLETVASGGDASRFSASELEELLAAVGTTIDSIGGSFTMRHATVVLTAARS